MKNSRISAEINAVESALDVQVSNVSAFNHGNGYDYSCEVRAYQPSKGYSLTFSIVKQVGESLHSLVARKLASI